MKYHSLKIKGILLLNLYKNCMRPPNDFFTTWRFFYLVLFLKQGLTSNPCLAWNLKYWSEKPWPHRDQSTFCISTDAIKTMCHHAQHIFFSLFKALNGTGIIVQQYSACQPKQGPKLNPSKLKAKIFREVKLSDQSYPGEKSARILWATLSLCPFVYSPLETSSPLTW